MNKKVISSVLAGAMALSTLGVSAFAADKTVKTAGATTYKVAATLAAPEINVTLPGAISAVVNPYGVSFEMKGQTYGAQGLTSGLYTIKNNTTASAVQVNVTATLTVPTTKSGSGADATITPNIAVLTKAASDYAKLKEKSIYAVIAGDVGTNLPVSTKDDAIPALTLFGDDAGENVAPVPFVDDTLVTKTNPSTAKPALLMTIPKATKAVAESAEGANDGVEATFGYGQFQIGGDITPNSVAVWTSADKINFNIVLDIGPAADPEAD